MSQPPRTWSVRVAFEPNRFSPEHLSHVYEHLKPVESRRAVTGATPPTAAKKRSAVAGGEQ
jgi:hypothetical protein